MRPETLDTLIEISKKDFGYVMILEVFDARVMHQAMCLASSPMPEGANEGESTLLFQSFMKLQAESVGINAVIFGLGGVYLHPTTRKICYETVVTRWADHPYWILDQIQFGYRKKFCRILELEKHEDGNSELSVFFGCP
jgi:hypothetical protein